MPLGDFPFSFRTPEPQETLYANDDGSGALCPMAANAHAAITEDPVTYHAGTTTMKGFLVYDDAVQCKRPGIVMVHLSM